MKTNFYNHYKIYLSIFLISFSFLLSCNSDKGNSSRRGGAGNSYKPYNITILLDLSDRDLSNNTITDIPIRHDTTAMRIILSTLKETFRLKIKDKISLECVHQDNSNYDQYVSDNFNKFKIDMEEVFKELKRRGKPALSLPVRKKEFDKLSNQMIKSVCEIEILAKGNPHPSGGDITKFLNEKLKYYFKQDYENILILLTDGDEAFNSNIKKVRPKIVLAGNYPGLKIFMCGINAPNSSKNPNEISVIRKNWIDKFKTIGIMGDDMEFNEVKDINLIETKLKLFIK